MYNLPQRRMPPVFRAIKSSPHLTAQLSIITRKSNIQLLSPPLPIHSRANVTMLHSILTESLRHFNEQGCLSAVASSTTSNSIAPTALLAQTCSALSSFAFLAALFNPHHDGVVNANALTCPSWSCCTADSSTTLSCLNVHEMIIHSTFIGIS